MIDKRTLAQATPSACEGSIDHRELFSTLEAQFKASGSRGRAFKKIVRLVGEAVAEFSMIQAGDRIAVGLSGGKDSLTLLHALLYLRRRAPIAFQLKAFTIEQGKFVGSLAGLSRHLSDLGVPWQLKEDTPSINLVRNAVPHGCDLCSRYRRRAVYQLAGEMGCNVVAFGHTADDFAEAMLRSLAFNGTVKPLPPNTLSSGREFRIIRPLLYVEESTILLSLKGTSFPLTPCACSLKEGPRTKIRAFLQSLAGENPHIYSNLISAAVKAWREKLSGTDIPL
jgi:tRNA 2-thiocytidine biosynthesis protein TtcA